MKYHFQVHKDKDGLWAECLELKGCRTQSEVGTMIDLKKNMSEALDLYLDEPEPGREFALPRSGLKGRNIVEVEVDPRIAFAILLKNKRKKHHLTQKDMAKKMGFKNIWSYQILETPHRSNPELSTIAKIVRIFKDFEFGLLFK